jgi:hypothetical protein
MKPIPKTILNPVVVAEDTKSLDIAPVNNVNLGGELITQLKDLTKAVKGSVDIDRGTLHDVDARPSQTIFTIASASGGGAGTVTAYVFNEDFLNATPTNNGSGAGSVVSSYNDGFAGRLISQITSAKGDAGLRAKQIQLTFTDNATGLQDKASLQASNPTFTTYNGDNSSMPQIIPIQSAGSPAYQQSGFLIVNIDLGIKRYSQFSFLVPAGKTASLVVVYA